MTGLSEKELMAGRLAGIPPRRSEPCACRGWIVADSPHPVSVVDAVQEHQAGEKHQAWRARGGMDAEPVLRRVE